MLSGLLGPTAGDDRMLSLFSSSALIRTALEFEAALADACAAADLINDQQRNLIIQTISELHIDVEQMAAATHHAGTLAIPLVEQIKAAVSARSPDAAAAVHLGSTSQDLADTVMVIQCRRGTDLLSTLGRQVCDALADLALQHANTPMIGRTLLRRALPITFGLKAANWLAALAAALARLEQDSQRLTLQCGGPVGTLAGLEGRGKTVSKHLAQILDLPEPAAPWHTQRTDSIALGASLALAAGALGKLAQDIALLGQDEIAEVAEVVQPGRGGSSAMSHKRNPTGAQQILAATQRLPPLAHTLLASMVQPHERGLTGWQLELPTLGEMFVWTYDALKHAQTVIAGLEVDTDAMSNNLNAAGVGHDYGEAEALTKRTIEDYRSKR